MQINREIHQPLLTRRRFRLILISKIKLDPANFPSNSTYSTRKRERRSISRSPLIAPLLLNPFRFLFLDRSITEGKLVNAVSGQDKKRDTP